MKTIGITIRIEGKILDSLIQRANEERRTTSSLIRYLIETHPEVKNAKRKPVPSGRELRKVPGEWIIQKSIRKAGNP